MSDSTKDRIEGGMDKAQGMAKEKLGDVTGDESRQAEGQADQDRGDLKQGVADVKDKVDDTVKNLFDKDK